MVLKACPLEILGLQPNAFPLLEFQGHYGSHAHKCSIKEDESKVNIAHLSNLILAIYLWKRHFHKNQGSIFSP